MPVLCINFANLISFLFVLQEQNAMMVPEPRVVTKSAGTSPEFEQEQFKKTIFQRSVSEITSEEENSQSSTNRSLSRRRNNSGGVSGGRAVAQ